MKKSLLNSQANDFVNPPSCDEQNRRNRNFERDYIPPIESEIGKALGEFLERPKFIRKAVYSITTGDILLIMELRDNVKIFLKHAIAYGIAKAIKEAACPPPPAPPPTHPQHIVVEDAQERLKYWARCLKDGCKANGFELQKILAD